MFACPAPPAGPPPRADRPRYVLRVHVAHDLKTADGTVTVRFTPNRDTPRVVLRLWPNGPRQRELGMHLDTGRVTVDGRAPRVTRPDPTTLVAHTPVQRGETVVVSVPWRLHVPDRGLDRIARWSGGVRLGSFFPILPWDPRRGWITDPPSLILGESSTSPTADFDVRVDVPRGFRAVASGTPDGPGRWRAHAVRDVGVAVGRFRIVTGIAHAPNPVTLRVAVAGGAQVPRDVLSAATAAIQRLAQRYGPYRWKTYTLSVTPDIGNAGIEYPTLVFLGRGSFIRSIVDHETAHQWFYSLVGNDQERDPWLDEALATWAQLQLDGGLPPHLQTLEPPRHVGAPMSFFARQSRRYFREVYGGGVQALASLHANDRVNCALRLYAARNAFTIAQPRDLLAELNRVVASDAAQRLRRFGIHP